MLVGLRGLRGALNDRVHSRILGTSEGAAESLRDAALEDFVLDSRIHLRRRVLRLANPVEAHSACGSAKAENCAQTC